MAALTRTAAVLMILLVSTRLLSQVGTSGPVEFDSTAGAPGEVVEVSVRATYDYPLVFAFIAFRYDAERLDYLGYDVKGSAAEGVDPIQVGSRDFGDGTAFLGIFENGDASWRLFRTPPGERQLLGRIRFILRADAPLGIARIEPVTTFPAIGGSTTLALDVGDNGTIESFVPEAFAAGSVEVQPPRGMRPVGDLECSQFLDQARVAFTVTEPYSALEVRLDGELLSTLPGDATSFTHPIPRPGRLTFSITALGPAGSSVPSVCEIVATAPAAPSVQELVCGAEGLSWQNPLVYDEVLVSRDGDFLSSLPGNATSFVDPDRPASMTLYSVSGILQGYRSPEATCLANGTWIMEVGDVEAALEADRVTVPILVTTSDAVRGMDFCLQVDRSRFTPIRDRDGALEGAVGYYPPEFLAVGGVGACGHPAAGIVFDYQGPREPEKDLAPGLRQHVINFIFRPVGPMQPGETFSARLVSGSFSLPPAESHQPDLFIPGTIRFGSTGVAPVESLKAETAAQGSGGGAAGPEASDIRLSWKNGSDYELLRIEKNGEPIGEIAGGATEYVDQRVPSGVFTYKVIAVRAGKTSFPRSTLFSTIAPRGAFLRGDSNHDGRIDIGDPIRTLRFLFLGGDPLACEDGADANDDGKLEVTDAIVTLNYLFNGTGVLRAPGTRYPWYDPTPDQLSCGS